MTEVRSRKRREGDDMWLSDSEKEQVCLLCVQLEPDLGITDIESYLDALDDYCHAQTKKDIFAKLNKDEVVDFCYRTKEGYPDHYDALNTNHKQIIRQCVLALL